MTRLALRLTGRTRGTRLLVRCVAAPMLVLLGWCLATPPAGSHVLLSQASPEPESRSEGAPSHVQLRFAVPAVADPRTEVEVVAPSGQLLSDGAADVTGLGVSQTLTTSEETGWFRVQYRVVIWGGHLDSGEFRFRVEPDRHDVAVSTWVAAGGGAATVGALLLIGQARRRAARPGDAAS